MHTKCTLHIYYIVHTELLGDSEPHMFCYINHGKLSGTSQPIIFVISCTQNCQVLVNQTHLLYYAHKCQVIVKQIHLLCYAHKICLQILQGRRHFAE